MIVLNGERREDLGTPLTVEALLRALHAGSRGVAVAVESEVVPRGDWPSFEIHEGAAVEVVHAVQGG